ncbi:PTS system trehalose-specific EIIBC component [Paludibacterium purpuratum]|uniref:PTS system trehalose-specific IIB component (Glc family) /PTS system trehalose-specific IIC component (Glc family) n=1 Tax=Paludibacterium purpuratum TaxID=1144873 RepID=A0A4R7BAE4_9NEIS|nr:PTS system trehalose-specific EIIBC component [Paludibacterium purpuratum]TDR80626.1 PTS system trehalose-specific IIB component (Glc family) /PTS system trehalose-specific IIC component (Glc family) [Paludibacterium purpuratum]
MSHDFQRIAARIVEAVGGKNNIQQAAHCITRLRLSLRDERRVDGETLRQIELVKGHFSNGGVYQVVIGSGDVERVYESMLAQTGLQRATVADVKASGGSKQNKLQQLVKVFSDVFMPILPAIIVAGLLMGVNNLLGSPGMFIAGKSLLDAYPGLSGVWSLINMMANTSFVFLPALVGWSAAKRFGGSEILGIVLGLLLVHPDLLNAWNYGKAAAGLDGASLPYFELFGVLHIEKVGYQGQILPILIATWVMSQIEQWLRARVHNSVQLLIVPIVTIVISGLLALAVIGPLARHLGMALTTGLVHIFNLAPVLGAMLFGALYAPMVITGMHHMFIAVDLQLIASQGGTFIWPMIALSNIAQGSAALAMFLVARDNNDKSMASTSALSAYFGITEPAMFGVNLRFKLPFYAALTGSALSAAVITLNHVRALAIGVGGLPAFISIVPQHIPMFLVGMLVAIMVPMGMTFALASRIRAQLAAA